MYQLRRCGNVEYTREGPVFPGAIFIRAKGLRGLIAPVVCGVVIGAVIAVGPIVLFSLLLLLAQLCRAFRDAWRYKYVLCHRYRHIRMMRKG